MSVICTAINLNGRSAKAQSMHVPAIHIDDNYVVQALNMRHALKHTAAIYYPYYTQQPYIAPTELAYTTAAPHQC
jgi:hypothetical protein